MKQVTESGMCFGNYPDDSFFAIENSELHKYMGEGIKTVEFVLLGKDKKIFFIEAKTSCPNGANKHESPEKSMKFEEYYRDITEKFFDSLQMFLTAVLNKTSNTEEIGKKLIENKDYSETDICFVLVIENATDPAWLAGPKAELDERLKKL